MREETKFEVWDMELVNTVKQLTNVTNVTLASDDARQTEMVTKLLKRLGA